MDTPIGVSKWLSTRSVPTKSGAVWRSASRSTPLSAIHSSASTMTFQSASASFNAALRAAEKSSHHAKWPTRAPAERASATVASVEPVSRTTSSSTQLFTLASARTMRAASLRAIITRATR